MVRPPLIIAAAALLLALAGCSGAPGGGTTPATVPTWPAPSGAAVQRNVQSAGLTLAAAEGEALHIHSHLAITEDGRAITVPAGIGIEEGVGLSSLHTHDTTGIIHVESPQRDREFDLGQVFAEWGQPLSRTRVGSLRADGDTRIAFVVNGVRVDDPASILLRNLQNIDIIVTHGGAPAVTPAPFSWPAQYR